MLCDKAKEHSHFGWVKCKNIEKRRMIQKNKASAWKMLKYDENEDERFTRN